MATMVFNVIQGNRFCYQSKAHVPLSTSDTNLHPVSYRLKVIAHYLSKLCFGQGGASLEHTHSRLIPKPRTTKFGIKKLETLYCVVPNVFRYLEPFRSDSRVRQTDGQNRH